MSRFAPLVALGGIAAMLVFAFVRACSPSAPKFDVAVHWTEDQETGYQHVDWLYLCADGVRVTPHVVVVDRGERGRLYFPLDAALPLKLSPSRYCP